MRSWVWALVAMTVGCGGKAEYASGRSGDEGGPVDRSVEAGADSPSPWSPVCPEAAQVEFSPCSVEGIACEYGCNNVLMCGGGIWGGAPIQGVDSVCVTSPNASSCPVSLSGVAPGATCSNAGDTCFFADGICQCNAPQAPPPPSSPAAANTWFCGPQNACPMPRPRIGSACSTPSLRCDYTLCGASQVCMGGLWTPTSGQCAQ
jgi:hypothetical protein